MLLFGIDPMRIYVYKEGLARLATEPYQPPQPSNLSNLYMHLTNYSINKNSENFEFNEDEDADDIGHKRSLTAAYK